MEMMTTRAAAGRGVREGVSVMVAVGVTVGVRVNDGDGVMEGGSVMVAVGEKLEDGNGVVEGAGVNRLMLQADREATRKRTSSGCFVRIGVPVKLVKFRFGEPNRYPEFYHSQ